MKITAIVCPKCKEKIFSRATHDFHWCHCGNTAVDGGLQYLKITAKEDIDKVKTETIDLNVSSKKLYDDWNLEINNFGWIDG